MIETAHKDLAHDVPDSAIKASLRRRMSPEAVADLHCVPISRVEALMGNQTRLIAADGREWLVTTPRAAYRKAQLLGLTEYTWEAIEALGTTRE